MGLKKKYAGHLTIIRKRDKAKELPRGLKWEKVLNKTALIQNVKSENCITLGN